jgi:hypothetical protein
LRHCDQRDAERLASSAPAIHFQAEAATALAAMSGTPLEPFHSPVPPPPVGHSQRIQIFLQRQQRPYLKSRQSPPNRRLNISQEQNNGNRQADRGQLRQRF